MASTRDQFTNDEWSTLQYAWLWAYSTMTASPYELMTIQPDIGEAPIFRGQPLARSVVESLQRELTGATNALNKDGRTAVQGFADVAAVLDRKATPEEAEGFKNAVLGFASQVVSIFEGMLEDPETQSATVDGRPLREYLSEKIAEGKAAMAVIASSLGLSS